MHMGDQQQPEIRAMRLVLRALRASDAEALFVLFNNWEVVRWLSLPPWPYTLDDARAFTEGAVQRRLDGGEASYAVTLQDALMVASACACARRAMCSAGRDRISGSGSASPSGGAAT